jgi:hypothetical protein
LPRSGNVLLSVRDADKPGVVEVARRLARLGFRLLATRGTAEFLRRAGVPVCTVAKCEEGAPSVLHLVDQGEIQLLIDTSLWADEVPGGRGPGPSLAANAGTAAPGSLLFAAQHHRGDRGRY